MPRKLTVTVSYRHVVRNTNLVAEDFKRQLALGLTHETAKETRKRAMDLCPVLSGFLRDRHYVEPVRLTRFGPIVARVANDAVYAARQHATHRTKRGWLRRAATEVLPRNVPQMARRAFYSTKAPPGGFKKGLR